MAGPRALVLITVDCLRADHTGFLGYGLPTTPFLNSLAEDSFVFSNAIVAGAPTYYSFPAIMGSRYPLALGRDVIGLAPDEPTIASALKESGYSTAAFLAGNPYLSRRFGYESGFDTFLDGLQVAPGGLEAESTGSRKSRGFSRLNAAAAQVSHKLGPLGAVYDELYFQYCQRLAMPAAQSTDTLRRFPGADAIVDQASAWVASVDDQPFFLWLHLMDPHSPYYPPVEAMEWMGQGMLTANRVRYLNSFWNRDLSAKRLERHRADVLALYDAGIRWVDVQVARLVESLRELGRWENCVFALTADHGEEFLDHGKRYHCPSQVKEELLRVPLLIRVAGGQGKKTVAAPFSLLHLAPTLLESVDVAVPQTFQGRSHLTQLETGQSWEEGAVVECVGDCTNPFRPRTRLGPRVLVVRESRYKLVLDFADSKGELFDLQNDPTESRPLTLDADRSVRRRLLDQARHHVADSFKTRDLDRRMSARLRDLRLEWTHSATQTPA
jgi:arylsulfatase A-like enzyme